MPYMPPDASEVGQAYLELLKRGGNKGLEGIQALLGGARDYSIQGARGIMDLLGFRPESNDNMQAIGENLNLEALLQEEGRADDTPVFNYLDEIFLPNRARGRRHGQKAYDLGYRSSSQSLPIKRVPRK